MSLPDAPPTIAIIGAGITGLAAAHHAQELAREAGRPVQVVILEAADRAGGVIRTLRRDGCVLEAGPDSFVNEQPWARALCERVGLADQLLPANTADRQSFVVHRGRLVPVPEGFYLLGPVRWMPFLTTPLISPWGKLRAAADLWLPPRRETTDESIAAFVRRRLGGEVLARLAEPLIGGMASGDVEYLSLQSVLPHVAVLEQQHGSVIRGLRARRRAGGSAQESAGARYGLFVALRDGMETLIMRLLERLSPGTVRLQTAVQALTRQSSGGWRLTVSSGETLSVAAVCVAVPPYAAAPLLRNTDALLAGLLEQPSYASWVTINLVYPRAAVRHPLNGFGCVMPRAEQLPLVGCTFSHVKFPGRVPADRVLLRAFVRLDGREVPALPSDEALTDTAHQTLARLLGITGTPQLATVHRHLRALPQYHVGHRQWVEAVRARVGLLPGLALAGNAYTGHGITHCVRGGELAAEALLAGVAATHAVGRP